MNQILIITEYFYPSLKATSQLITDLANGLTERGYQVNIFTATRPNSVLNESLNKIKINCAFSPIKSSNSIWSKIISSIFFTLGAWGYIIFRQPRNSPLLIVSNPPYAGLLGMCFNLLRGGKYYFLLQDIFPETAIMTGIVQAESILSKFLSKLAYLQCKYAQNTIVLSTSMQSLLEQKYPDLKQKIKVIENWAIEDIPLSKKQSNEFAKKYNIDQIFTVLYSGNIGRIHDIETIVKATILLKDKPIKFVFIGDGAKTRVLEKAIYTHQLKNILLLPYQPRELLPLSLTACDLSLVSLIAGAEAIVAPSKLYGMLAAGRAIVAISSPNSYIEQLLKTYGCGVNSPSNNSQHLANLIVELSSDPLKVKVMGEKARQLYESKYTFKRALDEYEQILFPNTSYQKY